jgi:VanZ family protein
MWWLTMFALTHTPKPPESPVHIPYADKIAHFVMFAVLATLTSVVARRSNRPISTSWFIKWGVIFAVYALIDETTQPLVRRTADVMDWAADMGGVAFGFTVVSVFMRRR